MDETYPHLMLQKEEPVNEKRSGHGPRIDPPADIVSHGRSLKNKLEAAKETASTEIGGFDERRLFRFTVQKAFIPDDLRKISCEIEFISQEDETVVVGFATERALAEFEARLSSLICGEAVTNKHVLFALNSIDEWGVENRKGWALKKKGFPEVDLFILDVELWPLEANVQEQDSLRQAFEDWLRTNDIELLDSVKQTCLTLYRVRCTNLQAELLLHHRDVRCADLPPSFGLEQKLIFQDIQDFSPVNPPADDAPGVVVLDSGLAPGHPLLAPAIGDAQSFLPGKDAYDENGHGTQVSGLALYGDFEKKLRSREFVPNIYLFSGRILDKNNENCTGFIENHIQNAVRYFSSEYGCKIFNLSFGDKNKPYFGGHLKGLSFTLDSLARELGVLFIVSVGNYSFNGDSPEGIEWRDNFPNYLLTDPWTLIEPAPAINALTVGSLARYDYSFSSQRYQKDPSQIAISKPKQPSPFTLHGPSIDGAIKPELMAHGGNWAIDTRNGTNRLIDQNHGLGVVSTCHQFLPPTSKLFAMDCGTSMSAPQIAHLAAMILAQQPGADNNLLRALLCVHASIPQECFGLFEHSRDVNKVCGYGKVDEYGLLKSLEDNVTLIASGTIINKHHHFYEIPFPEDFYSKGRRLREISVALAYTPIVRSTRVKYRASRIDYRLVAAPNLDYVTKMFNKATAENEYENISELQNSAIGPSVRSKGTVQADTWRFTQFNRNSILKKNKLFLVVTRNDHAWGEPLCSTDEKYSIAVCLRDRENKSARLYSHIRNQIQTQLRARART